MSFLGTSLGYIVIFHSFFSLSISSTTQFPCEAIACAKFYGGKKSIGDFRSFCLVLIAFGGSR